MVFGLGIIRSSRYQTYIISLFKFYKSQYLVKKCLWYATQLYSRVEAFLSYLETFVTWISSRIFKEESEFYISIQLFYFTKLGQNTSLVMTIGLVEVEKVGNETLSK